MSESWDSLKASEPETQWGLDNATFNSAIDLATRGCDDSAYINRSYLSPNIKGQMYLDHQPIRNAVDVLPTRALNTFRGWNSDADLNTKETKSLSVLNEWFTDKWLDAIREALIVGRLYGDSYIWVDVMDNKDTALPLGAHQGILRTEVFAAHELSFDNNDYDYSSTAIPSASRGALIFPHEIHVSRLIRVPGKLIAAVLREQSYGYGHTCYSNSSVLDTFYASFLGWVQSNGSAIELLQGHSLFIMKMKNLALKVSAKDEGGMSGRFSMILKSMKRVKGLFIDSAQEDASFINRQYSGVDSILDCIESYMCSSSDTPREFLVEPRSKTNGISLPAREELAQSIDLYVESHIQPTLKKILKIWELWASKPEEVSAEIKPQFGSSLLLSPTEKAAQRFKTIQGLALLQKSNALHTSEIRWTLAKDERLVEGQLNIDEKKTAELVKAQKAQAQPAANVGKKTDPSKKLATALSSDKGSHPYSET
jgi:hypothetical protein